MNETIESFVAHIRSLLPKYRILRKKDSTLMKILNVLLFFVPNFMTRFTTTVASTVYLTDNLMNEDSDAVISILAHEAQHVYDKNRITAVPYTLMYLAPQILVLCSLLSILAIWFSNAWLWSLLSLVLLAPIPSPGRMWVERRGYLMSLACHSWLRGEATGFRYINSYVKQFTAKNYYFMWPFGKSLETWFINNLTLAVENPKSMGPVFESVHTFIQKRRQS